jgi:spore maturation protein CgeB
MKIVMFYHSLVSDWNHGNAHFLRGVVRELQSRNHQVVVYEPENGWSLQSLISEQGRDGLDAFHSAYPDLVSSFYLPHSLDLSRSLDGADLVIVHEWTDPALLRRIGRHRDRFGHYQLLFHDTHHRLLSAPESMPLDDLAPYDGVLTFGSALREAYLAHGWNRNVWVWREAADTSVFHPPASQTRDREGDVVWIGNWDEEKTAKMSDLFLAPVRSLGVRALCYGLGYSETALRQLQAAGIDYRGWLPNFWVPQVYARFRVTIHLAEQPHRDQPMGVSMMRPFEAMACGIPLISTARDEEGLFRAGSDYLVAADRQEMMQQLGRVLADDELADSLSRHGRQAILARHTVKHRVDQLLAIYHQLCPAESATELAS